MTREYAGNDEKSKWSSIYNIKEEDKPPVYDDWLIKHTNLLEASKNIAVLDLGCGIGCDSLFLSERGFEVISCDWSEEALQKVRQHIPLVETLQLNLLEPLPFADQSAIVIIADLSLHYFSWEATLAITKELQRVLHPGGYLLCRVNSIKDVNFGAGIGQEIEPGYYEHEGHRKRFFDKDRLEQLFDQWQITYIEEAVLHRYGKPKALWEIAVKNLK
ncbi:Methyltransferase domain-containing protein [Paenibacillus sp. 1_12]|uniref:class I SAM-dependent methyltransferase n=1 Tax=Paenibacillus sp. 1_12 TaxID=1566278 RepID=UPI0008E9E9EA|nr:class I SAM-dependent methyltransferase [Paenibacillus sp. 1_12]SFL83833.1 Methyltransferase domain-containing protein [Paenibacillus sp. 1_12]